MSGPVNEIEHKCRDCGAVEIRCPRTSPHRKESSRGTDMLRMWTEETAIQGWTRVRVPGDVADFWAEMESLAAGK